MKSILNRDFEYTHSSHTDVNHLERVFQRARDQMEAEAMPTVFRSNRQNEGHAPQPDTNTA